MPNGRRSYERLKELQMKPIAQAHAFPSIAQLLLAVFAFAALQYPLAAKADEISDGKAAFSTCAGCHTVTDSNRLGPHLNGIIGRKAGSVPGFNYSRAMKDSNIVWDTTTLEQYLKDPQKTVPGNRMPFAGLQDEKKRDAIAAYLASLK
jgi:cytochrome c